MFKFKNSILTVFGLIVAVGFVAASIPVVGYGDSPRDSAVGSVRIIIPDQSQQEFLQHVRFSAHSGPSGKNPKGQVHLTLRLPPFETVVKGKVTCLSVTGTVARIAAKLDEPSTFFGSTVTSITLFVVNNGEPKGGDSVDDVRIGSSNFSPSSNCSSGGFTLLGRMQGNVVVTDATP